ncbi:hypothetical protein NQ314_012986 [Rhamnusium bicolor]|uniref:Uncharacterized protein n=1 Tax=Rhamnusium bicolor TaxID=1586634 RepID=A0AAV8X8W8_9CUCU|nr:hypothetical protein NQ314_012986 [Rhamnusium bicolor]
MKRHSQNEGDNAHSVIERQINRAKKAGPIYSPEQYVSLIRCAKKTGAPYKVLELYHDDIHDLKSLNSDLGWLNNIKDEDRNSFKLTEVKVLKVEKAHPGILFYKTTYEQNDYQQIKVLKERRNSVDGIEKLVLKKAYKKKIGITEKKRPA